MTARFIFSSVIHAWSVEPVTSRGMPELMPRKNVTSIRQLKIIFKIDPCINFKSGFRQLSYITRYPVGAGFKPAPTYVFQNLFGLPHINIDNRIKLLPKAA